MTFVVLLNSYSKQIRGSILPEQLTVVVKLAVQTESMKHGDVLILVDISAKQYVL